MGKLPGPRKPTRQFKCPWCKKEYLLLSQLQAHEPKCSKRPKAKCKHPMFSRKKRFLRIETVGKKHYELWEIFCGKCNVTIRYKKKRTG